jgi:hypothetical protein
MDITDQNNIAELLKLAQEQCEKLLRENASDLMEFLYHGV